MRRLSSPANATDSGLVLTPSRDATGKQSASFGADHVSPPEFRRKSQSAHDPAAKNAALEELNEEKIRWILAAAHDLLNKVNTLQAITEMLAEDRNVQTSHRATLQAIQACTDSMTHLLQDFEEIARAEAKKPWLELTPAPLLPVIEQSIALSRPAAQKKDIRLTLTCSGPVARLAIDALKLIHGISNLIQYLIRYGSVGGNINVLVDQDETSVLISFRERELIVPEEELRQMFTPFHRSRIHPASADDETFLGLAICRRLIEQHGGHIWAKSNPDEGTCVCIALPLSGGRVSAGAKEAKRKAGWSQPHPNDG
jgi:signal transduction histidine kinase